MKRKATAANTVGLAAIFANIAEMIDTANGPEPVNYSKLFDELNQLVVDIGAIAAPVNPQLAQTLAAYAKNDVNPAARDWAGFFAAIAAFAEKLLPLILPLFTKPVTA
jgi:hypothetical protein